MLNGLIIILFVGMIVGGYLVAKADSNFGRKIFWASAAICAAILLLTGCGSENKVPPATSNVESAEEKQRRIDEENAKRRAADEERARRQAEIEASKVKNLGMTPDQFRWSYNEVAAEYGVEYDITWAMIGEITLKIGAEQDIGQYNITPSLIFQCSVDKATGLCKEVWLLSQPQTPDQMMEMLIAYGLIMATLNPELSQEQRAALFGVLKLTPDKMAQLNNGYVSSIRGNVKYTTGKVNTSTLHLIASAKDL